MKKLGKKLLSQENTLEAYETCYSCSCVSQCRNDIGLNEGQKNWNSTVQMEIKVSSV